jgi:hypothetical protein
MRAATSAERWRTAARFDSPTGEGRDFGDSQAGDEIAEIRRGVPALCQRPSELMHSRSRCHPAPQRKNDTQTPPMKAVVGVHFAHLAELLPPELAPGALRWLPGF